jgi:hypothetical protein
MELLLVYCTDSEGGWSGFFEASRCHSKVWCCNKWLRRMVHNAAARYELIGRYFSGVVSRLCIRSLHAVITVLFYARLNILYMNLIHLCHKYFLAEYFYGVFSLFSDSPLVDHKFYIGTILVAQGVVPQGCPPRKHLASGIQTNLLAVYTPHQ